jgi:hypothetical protein
MTVSEELKDKAYQLGFEYESTRGSCSQCVLAALQETIGGVDDQVFQAIQGLSGGTVSFGSGTCGALVGGIVMIGSEVGRTKVQFDNQTPNRKVVEIGHKLAERFNEYYDGITCAEVQTKEMGRAFNMLDAEDKQNFIDQGGHSIHCSSVCGNAARWTIEIMEENGLI